MRSLGVLFIAAIAFLGAGSAFAQDEGEAAITPLPEGDATGEGTEAPILVIVPLNVVIVPLPIATPPSSSPEAPAPPAKLPFGAPPLGTSPY